MIFWHNFAKTCSHSVWPPSNYFGFLLFIIAACERETLWKEESGKANSPAQIDLTEVVCEPDSRAVRTVQERDNSLIIQVNCIASDDTVGPERGGTRRGFNGRGFRGQQLQRGRSHIAVAANHSVDGGVDTSSSSDMNPNRSQVEEEPEREQSRRCGTRSWGRWHGSGWRRGGAGRYFRHRPAGRPDLGTGDKNFTNCSPNTSTSDKANQASSSPLLADTSGEQNTRATDAEDVSAKTESNNNARGVRSANRIRLYVVRRRPTGRRNRASLASSNEARVTVPQNLHKTEDKTSTVPCSGPEAEDWDAECFPV